MHILLTNDDSFDSPLFHILYDVIKEQGHTLTCVMPATEQSWKGKSMTRFGKLSLEQKDIDGRNFYTFEGAPADCVNFGLYHLCDSPPDLVISGVNMGYNVSLSYILSSGTIGAAMESYLAGYPSLSLSQQLIPELYQYWYEHRSFSNEASIHFKKQVAEVLDRFKPEMENLVNTKGLWALEMPYELKEGWEIKQSVPSNAHYGNAFIKNEDGTFSHCSPRLEKDDNKSSDIFIMNNGDVALNKLNLRELCNLPVENSSGSINLFDS